MGDLSSGNGNRGIPENFYCDVINQTGADISAGAVVAIDLADCELSGSPAASATLIDGGIPIRRYDPDKDSGRPYLFLDEPLLDGQFGSAVVSGIIRGTVSGDRRKRCAKPAGGAEFVRSDSGFAIVIGEYSEFSILCLGSGAGGGTYEGCFAVTLTGNKLSVAPGWLTRNGDFVAVPQAVGIEPKNGVLCLCSSIDEKTNAWSAPEYKIATPSAAAYPIAEISEVRTVGGSTSARIRQFPVTVAVIMLSKPCPLAEY